MLFETQMASPHPSPYLQHEYLERLFEHLDSERLTGERKRYSWCESDGVLFVRRAIPTNDLPWHPLRIPRAGNSINFQLHARCRQTHGRTVFDPDSLVTRRARLNITDPIKLLAWIHRNGDYIGLQIEDAEVELSTRHIGRTGVSHLGVKYGFKLLVASFNGFATVRDPRQFEQGLTNGIGDSKAFGLGFMFFWERGSHHAA